MPVPRVDVRPRRPPALRSTLRARAGLRRRASSASSRRRSTRGGRSSSSTRIGVRRHSPSRSESCRSSSRRGASRRARLAFRERRTYTVAANWKIAVENYLECYHCAVAHPGFSRLVDVDPDAYTLECAARRWSQYGQARDGDGACQFHLVWPALKVNAYPGAREPLARARLAGRAGANRRLPRLLLRRRRDGRRCSRADRVRRPGGREDTDARRVGSARRCGRE